MFGIFDFIKSVVTAILQFIIDCFVWLFDFFQRIFDIIEHYVIATFVFLYTWLIGILNDFLALLADSLPDISGKLETYFSGVGGYLSVADAWLNLGVFIDLLSLYVIFSLTYASINFIIKMIPGEG